MKVLRVDLNYDYSDIIHDVVSVLSSGGVIVYPTDTLYGLGSNALDEKAVEKVFKIKKRPMSRPLLLLAKNMTWVSRLARLNKTNKIILEKVWPGKVTAVLPKRDIIPDILTAQCKTVGIRVADYAFIDKLLGKFGYPITSTSANISGEEPTNDINKIINIFKSKFVRPDLVIDAGILPKSDPSLVIDLTTDRPKILRVGPSKPEQLIKLLNI